MCVSHIYGVFFLILSCFLFQVFFLVPLYCTPYIVVISSVLVNERDETEIFPPSFNDVTSTAAAKPSGTHVPLPSCAPRCFEVPARKRRLSTISILFDHAVLLK